MKLSDLKPKEVKFKACGVKLTFRPFLISDDLKSQDAIKSAQELQEALQNYDFEKLSLLAWYQLTLESQKEVLKAVQGVYIDAESGEEIDAKLTPIEKFKHLFAGIGDQKILIESLLNCRGLNVPDLEDAEAVKKWAGQLKKLIPQTGQ